MHRSEFQRYERKKVIIYVQLDGHFEKHYVFVTRINSNSINCTDARGHSFRFSFESIEKIWEMNVRQQTIFARLKEQE